MEQVKNIKSIQTSIAISILFLLALFISILFVIESSIIKLIYVGILNIAILIMIYTYIANIIIPTFNYYLSKYPNDKQDLTYGIKLHLLIKLTKSEDFGFLVLSAFIVGILYFAACVSGIFHNFLYFILFIVFAIINGLIISLICNKLKTVIDLRNNSYKLVKEFENI